MEAGVRAALETLLPGPIGELNALGGGNIGDSWCADLASGERFFVKHYREGTKGLVDAEARGLDWLSEADALPTAKVVTTSDDNALLVLEWIESAPRSAEFAEKLGRGLAGLHRFGAPGFGFSDPGFIGSLPQANEPCECWADFYAYRRIEPLVRRAMDEGSLPAGLAREASRLLTRFDSLCGPAEEPARLHGDLWGGNVMLGPRGEAVLIDPASYGGHREIDLAMMRLFGGFPELTFDAYANEWPLAEEAEDRVLFYQLYPLLVHVILFGGGYVDQFAEGLAAYR